MKRYTKKIKNANNYCEYDLKYSPYTEIFDLTSNVQIEDYVNADLTLAIDKLGKLEDLEYILKNGFTDKNGIFHEQVYLAYVDEEWCISDLETDEWFLVNEVLE